MVVISEALGHGGHVYPHVYMSLIKQLSLGNTSNKYNEWHIIDRR